MITTQHARRIVMDTCNLASLFLRQVILTKPIALDAYREKTRELLLVQSRQSVTAPSGSNLAAVKLLEWNKEWSLVKYYGIQEYGRRRWGSKSNPPSVRDSDNKKTAQIAFMITSDQRRALTELGYSSIEIRSLKPIEALLLVRNSVKRETSTPNYDFKERLKELVEENDKLSRADELKRPKTVSMKHGEAIENHASTFKQNKTLNLSPQDAERYHVKPDVALALLNIDTPEKHGDIVQPSPLEDSKMRDKHCNELGNDTVATATNHLSASPKAEVTSSKPDTTVRPQDSQKLHVKPDVAAAYLKAHQTKDIEQQSLENLDKDEESTERCWYEVLEVNSKTQQEQIIALFSTRKEALDCVQIKESFRARSNTKVTPKSSSLIVRRRWNVE